ncbi:MAG TPA: orotate phosphoribosyltransferase [Thermoplasmata archaeon]|nr:orotate phosphoribosyltransferase [Thermoplasmata archaeon]
MSASTAVPPPSRDEIVRVLLDTGAVRFGEFTLASGKTSDVYVDVKKAWPDPHRLRLLGRGLAARVRPGERLAGMELGAVPLVVAAALELERPYVVLRKAVKEHGTRQAFEGEIPGGAKFVILEDVTTTGGSTARSVEIVRAAGGVVDRAIVVLDREEGAVANLAQIGVTLESLVTFSELRGARS